VTNSMSKENLQSTNERNFRFHFLEVRLPHSSVEVGQHLQNEGGSKIWFGSTVPAPFTVKTKAGQR